MKTPIKLFFEGRLVGSINSFSYETPRASGKVKFKNENFFLQLVSVTSMAAFDLEVDELDIPDDEEDILWEKKLSELGITWDDLKLDHDRHWTAQESGGESQNIYAVRFYENGLMEWRL